MKALTKEQKQAYLDADGQVCPFCNSSQIEGGRIAIDRDRAELDVKCSDCGKYWTDIYKLVAIEEDWEEREL